MKGDRVDRPLTVERLSAADLIAAAEAVITIVTTRHWRDATTASPQTTVCVTWVPNPPGETWTIELMDWSPTPVGEDAQQATETLLRPIVENIRPRAVTHRFRSLMDELSPSAFAWIANSGTMPNAAFCEPRWVEDRTVLTAGPYRVVDRKAVAKARESLAAIYARLALAPPPELEETVQDAFRSRQGVSTPE